MFFSWVKHLIPSLLPTAIILKLVKYKPDHKNKNLRESLYEMTLLLLMLLSLTFAYRCLLPKKRRPFEDAITPERKKKTLVVFEFGKIIHFFYKQHFFQLIKNFNESIFRCCILHITIIA